MEPKCGPKASRERYENRARLGSCLGAVLGTEKGMGRSRAAEWRRPLGGGKGGAKALEGALTVKSHTPLSPVGGRIQDASRSPPAHSSCRQTRRRRLHVINIF